MRFLAIGVVLVGILAGIVTAADNWLVASAEGQAEERLGEELGSSVDLKLRGGWPTSLSMLGGRIPEVTLAATDVPLQHSDAQLARLDAVLRDVEVSLSDPEGGGALPVRGGSGTFTVEIDEANVNRLVSAPGPITLGDGRGSIVLGDRTIDVVPLIQDGGLVLQPATAAPQTLSVPVELPGLPAQIELEAVEVRPGLLRLSGRVLRLQ